MSISYDPVSSNYYGKFQGISISFGVILTAGAIAAVLIPAVHTVMTLALPIALGVGAVLAYVTCLALSINRCRASKREHRTEQRLSVHPHIPDTKLSEAFMQQLYKNCEQQKTMFLENVRNQLNDSDYCLFENIVSLSVAETLRDARDAEDEDSFSSIYTFFLAKLQTFREISEALKEDAGQKTELVLNFYAIAQFRKLCQRLQDGQHVQQQDIDEFTNVLSNIGDQNASWNSIGDNPLIVLAKYGRPVEFVTMLAQKGANFNYQDVCFGNTPLMWAIANANNTMAQVIINADATQNFNLQDKSFGNTALILAIAKGYESHNANGKILEVSNLTLVEQLLQADADPNVKNKQGNSALMLAVIRRDPGMVAALLKKDAQIDFDTEALLNLSYPDARARLNSQARPNCLDFDKFEQSQDTVRQLLQRAVKSIRSVGK